MHALFMRIAIGCEKHFLPYTTGKRLEPTNDIGREPANDHAEVQSAASVTI